MGIGKYSYILENLSKMSRQSVFDLRSAVYTPIDDSSLKELAAFYSNLPYDVNLTDETYETRCIFKIATLLAFRISHQKFNNINYMGSLHIADVVKYVRDKNIEKRFLSIIDYRESDTLIEKIGDLVLRLEKLGYKVDLSQLLDDMINWNSSDMLVQKSWIKKLYNTDKGEK